MIDWIDICRGDPAIDLMPAWNLFGPDDREAYRRAIAFHGHRMQQLAESEVAREDLTDYLTAMRTDLADLWRRGEAARAPKQAS